MSLWVTLGSTVTRSCYPPCFRFSSYFPCVAGTLDVHGVIEIMLLKVPVALSLHELGHNGPVPLVLCQLQLLVRIERRWG